MHNFSDFCDLKDIEFETYNIIRAKSRLMFTLEIKPSVWYLSGMNEYFDNQFSDRDHGKKTERMTFFKPEYLILKINPLYLITSSCLL